MISHWRRRRLEDRYRQQAGSYCFAAYTHFVFDEILQELAC